MKSAASSKLEIGSLGRAHTKSLLRPHHSPIKGRNGVLSRLYVLLRDAFLNLARLHLPLDNPGLAVRVAALLLR